MTGDPGITAANGPEAETTPPAKGVSAPEASSTVTAAQGPKRRGALAFWAGAMAGGAISAAIGAGTAIYLDLGRPAPPAADPAEIAALRTELDALATRVAELVAELTAAPPPADPAAELAALAQRLAALESRPVADPVAIEAELNRIGTVQAEALGTGAAAATIEAARDAALAEVTAAHLALIAERAAEADKAVQAERTALLRARLAALAEAIETGASLVPILEDIGREGIAVPPALGAVSQGAPTLAQLLADWPEAARAALGASLRVEPDAPLGDRIAAFLRIQTGARSLAPREGDDPDALLSRIEASLRTGDLDAAAAGMDALPPEAVAALATWRGGFEARRAALAALADIGAAIDAAGGTP